MKAVFDPVQRTHDPQFFIVRGHLGSSAEQPERIERLLAGLEACQLSTVEPDDYGAALRARVHTPDYLDFLENAYELWQDLPDHGEEVVANVFANRYQGTYPVGIIGRAGHHMSDTACPIGRHTWTAACASANSAVTAAQYVIDGDPAAYALCRPPGHHAYADMAGGFCFLNNVAMVADYLTDRYPRVAVLDIDVHHGNGTQGIFYHRSDVLTISIHTDPASFYPFHCGYSHERGEGEGEGYNINIPLPPLSGAEAILASIDSVRRALDHFSAGALVVALGLDTSEDDPLRGMSVKTEEFALIGKAVAELSLPTVYVQEGGYLSPALSKNLSAFVGGVQSN